MELGNWTLEPGTLTLDTGTRAIGQPDPLARLRLTLGNWLAPHNSEFKAKWSDLAIHESQLAGVTPKVDDSPCRPSPVLSPSLANSSRVTSSNLWT